MARMWMRRINIERRQLAERLNVCKEPCVNPCGFGTPESAFEGSGLWRRRLVSDTTRDGARDAMRQRQDHLLWTLCIHSAHSALTAYFAHFSCVSHTRMAQVQKKGVCRMSVSVLYLAFSLLMFHPSLLFLVHPLRHPLSVHNLAVHAPLRTCIAKFWLPGCLHGAWWRGGEGRRERRRVDK